MNEVKTEKKKPQYQYIMDFLYHFILKHTYFFEREKLKVSHSLVSYIFIQIPAV